MFDCPDFVGNGLRERLVDQFTEKPRLQALLESYLDELTRAAEALCELSKLRALDTATGHQLDMLGGLVGQPRVGLIGEDDDKYRALLRARAAFNRSSGTVNDILLFTQALLLPESLSLKTHRLELELFVFAPTEGFASDMAAASKVFETAPAAGVRLWICYWDYPFSDAFGFDDSPGFDSGIFGASIDTTGVADDDTT